MNTIPTISDISSLNETYCLFSGFDGATLERELLGAPEKGEFHNAVIGLKSNIAVKGATWNAGLECRQSERATSDSNVVQKLRQVGFRFLPSLNMDAAALGGTSDNAAFGRTRNPHESDHSAGGSSGGSAAAIACGLVEYALGTDTLGSIRIPASYCGVFGLKPTFGLVGRSGIVPLAPSLDVVGPLTRHAAQLRPILNVLAGLDKTDPGSRTPPLGWADMYSIEKRKHLRIGLPDSISEVTCDRATLDALKDARTVLADQGAEILSVKMPNWRPTQLRKKAFLLTECEGAVVYQAELERDGTLPEPIRKMLAFGRDVAASKLVEALAEIRMTRAQVDQTFNEVDCLLMPTTPQRAFHASQLPPANQADFTTLANVTGIPALAVPVNSADASLPTSVQLMGPKWSEDLLIDIAELLESKLA